MKKVKVFLIIISMCFSTFSFLGAVNGKSYVDLDMINDEEFNLENLENMNGDAFVDIIDPESGYIYLFKLKPIRMPIVSALNLGYSIVVDRNLEIVTASEEVDHVKFVARGRITGWESVRWDYQKIDGLSTKDLDLKSGMYNIDVYGYDELENELCSDSLKVLFIKVGRDDFGIKINTIYNGGAEISTPLDIGLTEFASMLNTGESKFVDVPIQNQDDTSVELRFTRTKILDGTENVIETKFNIETLCDTSRDYEISLEMRFPFIMLNGGQPSSDDPYFSAKVGYKSSSIDGGSSNKVDTTFYFGRDSIDDPRVFRMSLKPQSLDENSKITYFNSYLAVDSVGETVFHRTFSVDFEPATDLTITTIPGEAKISYDFGDSAGVSTKISFRAEGGIFDDIIQSFFINPLPQYMSFDLTLIGSREFIYESDNSYDIQYSIDSIQNGNLVVFEVVDLPKSIHASCGIDIGEFGDLYASSYAEIDMSSDIESLSLYLNDNELPFISLDNIPRKLRYEGFVDVLNGLGNLSFYRGIDDVREINVNLVFDTVTITKTFELKNEFISLVWDIDLQEGVGDIHVLRDSNTEMEFSTSIGIGEWTFEKSLTLSNTYIDLAWEIDRDERNGRITFSKDSTGGSPLLSVSISHNDWSIVDTIELNNELIEVYWDLPTSRDSHGEIGLNTGGNEVFLNTLSLVEDDVELLSLGIGIQIGDNFEISWDNIDGDIKNFKWSGNIINLPQFYVSVNLPGDVLTISADLIIGQEGSFGLELNRDVDVNFIDVNTDRFKINGHVSFNANSPLDVSWKWGEIGYFTVDTNGQAIGDDFSFGLYWDPSASSNYRYGFILDAPEFLETYFHVDWWKDNDTFLPMFWVIWNPVPLNWDQWGKTLLWDYEFYQVPWPNN